MPRSRNIAESTPASAPHVALLVETSLASGREILRGVARYVRERGPWSLFHAPRGLEESAPAWLQRWQGDGVIARVTTPELGALLRRTKLPVVDVIGMAPGAGFPVIHVDDAAIARMAYAHFAERGFRRFAFFGIARENWSERRRDAYLASAAAVDPTPGVYEIPRRELEDTPWETRQDRLAHWLQSLPKPVGLMVCSDQRGPDVLEACRRVGINVPDEIAIVGVDNDEPLCEVCNPPLSSVWPDHFAVGYQAAAFLHRQMQLRAGSARRKSSPTPASSDDLPPPIAPRGMVIRQSSDVLAVEDSAVAAALRIIRERACAGVSIDEIARAAGASRSVLQRRFIALLGQTIHDQIITQRLKRAVELISTTDLPLMEIAERCGFRHQEYMGVVFRERLGKTPAQYRHASRD